MTSPERRAILAIVGEEIDDATVSVLVHLEMYFCTPGMNIQWTSNMNLRRSFEREAVLVSGVVLTGVAVMRRMIDEVNTSTLLTTLNSYCQPCPYNTSVV